MKFLYFLILLAIISYAHIISSNLKIAEREITKLQREIKAGYHENQLLKQKLEECQFRRILWARERWTNVN